MRRILSIVLGCCLLLVGSVSAQSQRPIQAFFNDPIYGRANGLDQALVDMIDSAQTRIDAHFFQIGRQNIVNALVDAANRLGPCNVRIISDEDYMERPSYKTFYQDLLNAGITIVTPACDGWGPRDNHSHNKFCIVDVEQVWTGGYNITDFGTILYHDDAVIVRHSGVAQAYLDEFNEMWGSENCTPNCDVSRFGPNKFDNTQKHFDVDGRHVEVYFSPGDSVRQQILDELSTAEQGIYFCIFSFTRNDIADAIMERHAQGVEVLGVVDRQGADNIFGAEYETMEDVVPVKRHDEVRPHTNLLHHKFAVVDPFGSDPRVITGSYNWTTAAEVRNDENTIIIRDRAIAEEYYCQVYERYHGQPCVKPTPYASPTPSPTPQLPNAVGVHLSSPQQSYDAGEEVTYTYSLYNQTGQEVEGRLFLMLEVAGTLLYIPSFEAAEDPYDHEVVIPANHLGDAQVFLGPFPSPDVLAPTDITVYGELLNLDTNQLEGGRVSFTTMHN